MSAKAQSVAGVGVGGAHLACSSSQRPPVSEGAGGIKEKTAQNTHSELISIH